MKQNIIIKIHGKKMLAIIRGLEVWRHLLKDAKFKFEVWTDHKNLEYFMKALTEVKQKRGYASVQQKLCNTSP